MISILGGKRILTLLGLLLLNLIFAASFFLYLTPTKLQKERDLKTLDGKISSTRSEIYAMQDAYKQLQNLEGRFEVIKESGFFNLQRRRDAEDMLQEVQDKSGVISASVKLSPGKANYDIGENRTDYILLESPMEIQLDALDDLDVFRYIYYIQEFFPGHISIENIELTRERELSADILKGISSEQNPKMVGALVKLVWRTMIPKSEYGNDSEDDSNGGRG